jgi:hypothetical protein
MSIHKQETRMEHKELLKSMLHDVINDRQEQASVTLHDYFVSKMRDITGLGTATQKSEPVTDQETVDEE